MNQPSGANASALFQTGGTLPIYAPTYVERDADAALYAAIQAREFCYVLNSRQMGKSSLRARIMGRLQAEEVACAAVDLSALGGQQVNGKQWYGGVIRKLVSGFELTQRFNLRSWLRDNADLPPVQQLGEFIESILLTQIAQPIVIFIDEIDSVLSLNFSTDDLFTFIRACYNQRVDDPAYGRLTFVLLGVATPADLVRDKSRTPFNVGRSIELSGLTFDRAQPLIESLGLTLANPAEVLQTILAWSQGQPFLTQRLCRLVVDQCAAGAMLSVEAINQLVQSRVIENWQTQDEQDHLRTIQDRVLQDERKAGRRLGIYQQILQQGAMPYDGSPEQMELRLSGLIVARGGELEVYNQIYKSVFNAEWVNQSLTRLRPYSEAILAWLDSERQDDSRLLRGRALIEAQGWALGKSLSTQDYEFFAASRELDLQEIRETLATQQEANQILAEANAQATKLLTLSARASELERQGAALLKYQPQRFSQIEVLLAAVKLGHELKELLKANTKIQSPLTLGLDQIPGPELALRIAVNRIIEVNQVKGRARFSSDEQRILSQISQENLSLVYNPNGIELFQLKGRYITDSEDGARIFTTVDTDNISFVYNQSGQELLQLKGCCPREYNVQKRIFTDSGCYQIDDVYDEITYVYDQTGKELFQLKGNCPFISDDGKIIYTSSNKDNLSFVYNNYGAELLRLKGQNPKISDDGQRIGTSSDQDEMSFVYDRNGMELFQLKGNKVEFSTDCQRIRTCSSNRYLSFIYNWNGKELFKLRGCCAYIRQNEPKIITYLNTSKMSFVYDKSGQEILQLKGHYESTSYTKQNIFTSLLEGNNSLSFIFSQDGQEEFQILGGAPHVSEDEKYMVTYSYDEKISHIYDLIAQPPKLKGEQPIVISDKHHIFTQIKSLDLSYMYDKKGNELLQLPGNFPGMSADKQGIFTSSVNLNLSYFYDQNGKKIFQVEGVFPEFSNNGQYFATSFLRDDSSSVYSSRGDRKCHLKGIFPTIGSDEKRIFTMSGKHNKYLTYAYSLNGEELFKLKGGSPNISTDEERIFTSMGGDNLSYAYDMNGKILFELKGISPSIRHDGKFVTTHSYKDNLSYVYNLNGALLCQVRGSIYRIYAELQRIFLRPDKKVIRVCDLSGKEFFYFKGDTIDISTDENRIAISSGDDRVSRIYSLNGDLIAEYPGYEATFLGQSHLILRSSINDVLEIWPIDDGLDDLLQKGCYWLRHYFASHPEERLEYCS
ncbi:AAA-like domain-containing protein [Phormidium tenue]|uniref:Uncharacterized protein n=1 Tax=Phormidium tenue NIES-30 TaxID=549789 RepID=A0A1U7J5I1_9CYAN|nr:AAA-like domain-containing protein [Phormidium tenue]MBD2232507.1 AAA-like domain-containing protein [Phormidium tenue FACHB-1052]OKH48016.1 hypothetical protein NIES30_10935 [Phormidium tenue NIES-30]